MCRLLWKSKSTYYGIPYSGVNMCKHLLGGPPFFSSAMFLLKFRRYGRSSIESTALRHVRLVAGFLPIKSERRRKLADERIAVILVNLVAEQAFQSWRTCSANIFSWSRLAVLKLRFCAASGLFFGNLRWAIINFRSRDLFPRVLGVSLEKHVFLNEQHSCRILPFGNVNPRLMNIINHGLLMTLW